MKAALRTLLAGVLLAAPAGADPELSWRIAELTHQLELAPDDASLYLRRGALRRVARDFERAHDDLEAARRLEPALGGLGIAIALVWLDAGRPERALAALADASEPSVDALVLRGRAHAALGEPLAAAADLTAASRASALPAPELYLERSELLARAGDAHLADALAALDEGIARLGPAYSLVRAAVELEVDRERYASALARSERLPEAVRRRPEWLARRGDWWRALGRESEARAEYRAAYRALRAAAVDAAEHEALARRIAAALDGSPPQRAKAQP